MTSATATRPGPYPDTDKIPAAFGGSEMLAYVDRLSYRHRRILEDLYGLRGPQRTVDEVARTFNITADSVLEIEHVAFTRLLSFAQADRRAEANCQAMWRTRRERQGVRGATPQASDSSRCEGERSRESRRDAPGRFRGSRRTGSGSRASPDDGEGDRPPGLTLGRQGRHNLIGGHR